VVAERGAQSTVTHANVWSPRSLRSRDERAVISFTQTKSRIRARTTWCGPGTDRSSQLPISGLLLNRRKHPRAAVARAGAAPPRAADHARRRIPGEERAPRAP